MKKTMILITGLAINFGIFILAYLAFDDLSYNYSYYGDGTAAMLQILIGVVDVVINWATIGLCRRINKRIDAKKEEKKVEEYRKMIMAFKEALNNDNPNGSN